jgi:hypothetical protein
LIGAAAFNGSHEILKHLLEGKKVAAINYLATER